jgi:pimeloyl-ACP methyl ester carboxylesterase
MTDQQAGRRMYEEAVAMEQGLPEPARRLLHYATTRDVAALGPLVIGALPDFASDPALSPERSPAPSAPVFLLHGEDDGVIPCTETVSLSRWLVARHTRVRTLVTPLISHAEVQTASPSDALRLIAFWAGVMGR